MYQLSQFLGKDMHFTFKVLIFQEISIVHQLMSPIKPVILNKTNKILSNTQ